MLKTSHFQPNPTLCILHHGLKMIWGNFQTAASDSYFWKKRNNWVSKKTTTTNLNRNYMAYPTLFHAVGTQCLVVVFLPLVCFLLVFFPGDSQFYIYIYILCHPQTVSVSQLISMARHARCLKLGSKPGQLYVSLIT